MGSVGLTQLSMKKSVVRPGWSLYPGGRDECRHPRKDEVVQPTYHFWSWPLSLFGHFFFTRFYADSSRVFNLTGPSLTDLRVEARRGPIMVPRASYLQLLVSTSG